ncbi:hypothetical protein OVA03_12445 [Asticcacaulis sp. SL142]|uniref:hypothetical protein n=1 Tax=Asticcacaulis sp. SL142 TaxID=2995155 RepID=UPI00226C72B6|nr:hypothetical protein [Asticcacaulis sp. SL142]WAC47508.1 hypothetical protein OVA03_12445 [Asticcacaulis sp. SL142]
MFVVLKFPERPRYKLFEDRDDAIRWAKIEESSFRLIYNYSPEKFIYQTPSFDFRYFDNFSENFILSDQTSWVKIYDNEDKAVMGLIQFDLITKTAFMKDLSEAFTDWTIKP